MKQFTISIPDSKADLFLEIVKSISFVKKIEEGYQQDIPEEHKNMVRERIKKYENKPESYLEFLHGSRIVGKKNREILK